MSIVGTRAVVLGCLFACGAGLITQQAPPGGSSLPDIDAEVDKATNAAKEAWKLVKEVQKKSEANNKFVPLVKAQVALAKTAMVEAKVADAKLTALVTATEAKADAAALEAAKMYYKMVQQAGTQATKGAGEEKQRLKVQAEIKAAKAAAAAAMPYQEQILRSQKIIHSYMTRVNALAAASTNLKIEAVNLANAAPGYQSMGQAVQAQQLLMQAKSLFGRGEALKSQAESLHDAAVTASGAMGAYQLAEQSAATAAAAVANPPTLPDVGVMPY